MTEGARESCSARRTRSSSSCRCLPPRQAGSELDPITNSRSSMAGGSCARLQPQLRNAVATISLTPDRSAAWFRAHGRLRNRAQEPVSMSSCAGEGERHSTVPGLAAPCATSSRKSKRTLKLPWISPSACSCCDGGSRRAEHGGRSNLTTSRLARPPRNGVGGRSDARPSRSSHPVVSFG
jgi:hypothetical protein